MARIKHVPTRSCVACGAKTAKRDLMRIVATPQGTVEVDPTGKLPGRGAYICKGAVCLCGPPRKERLEYALRTRVASEDWEKVTSSILST